MRTGNRSPKWQPVKIEQRKDQRPEWGPQVEQTAAWLANLHRAGPGGGTKHTKRGDKRPGVSLLCARYIRSFSLSFSSLRVFGLSCPHSWGEKAMAPHSSTLAWKIPWVEEPGRLQSMGSLRVRYDWATSLSLFTFMPWRRTWQPTPVFLPGESQGRGSLVGCRLWGRTESDTTEAT